MSEKVIALLLIAIGAAISIYLWQQSAKAQQAASWPSTAGKIVSSEVDWRQMRGGDSSDRKEYRAIVRYEYLVAGSVHHAQQLRFPNPGYGGSEQQPRTSSSVIRPARPCRCSTTRRIPKKPAWSRASTGRCGWARPWPR